MGLNDAIRADRLGGLAWLAATIAFCVCGCGAPQAASPPTGAEPRQPKPAASADAPAAAASAVQSVPADKLAYMAFQAGRADQLRIGRVRRQLRLTEEQFAALGPALQRGENLPDAFRAIPPEKRAQHVAVKLLPMAQELDQTLESVLTDEQSEQLFRLALNAQQGEIVLLFPGVPTALGLSDQQQEDIGTIVCENFETFTKSDFGWTDIPHMIETAYRSRARAFGYLTEKQRQRWQQLLEGR